MKLSKKQRIVIMERAYDKAAKLVPEGKLDLAPLEREVLSRVLQDSRTSSILNRRSYKEGVWKHFGWDTPEAKERYQQMIKEVIYGHSRSV